MSETNEVLAAAAAIVDDFGHHRTSQYFAGFAPDATFMFYTHTERLNSRAEYETLWAQWETNDGFRVHGCRSSNQKVQELRKKKKQTGCLAPLCINKQWKKPCFKEK